MGGGHTTVRSPRKPGTDRAGPPRLRVTAGAQLGAVFELDEGEWIVGKGDDARIRLTDSGVSRRHAKIVISSDGMVVILDLQSTNGTFVNDNRVEMTALREGHRIGIGPDAELEFTRQDDPPAAPRPRRELQIARLVAQGLTNPQIAERLGVKPRTVSSHLDNIYARLKISSRAALTRYIIEGGLL
jgi:DNA-binding CsgD family transcriptional regulator